MKLYHFTARRNLKRIGKEGLVPAIGENSSGACTLGLPAVWLTSKPMPTWMIGCPDNLYMLTLDVRRSKRLHHWRTWLGGAEWHAVDEHDRPIHVLGKEILATLDAYIEPTPLASDPAAATENYFIYIGTIPHGRIVKAQRVEYVVEN